MAYCHTEYDIMQQVEWHQGCFCFFFLRILCSDGILSCVCSFLLQYYTCSSVYSLQWVLCSIWNSSKVSSGCLCLDSLVLVDGFLTFSPSAISSSKLSLILRKISKHVFIQIQICTDIHGYQMMNPNDSGDLLSRPLVSLDASFIFYGQLCINPNINDSMN